MKTKKALFTIIAVATIFSCISCEEVRVKNDTEINDRSENNEIISQETNEVETNTPEITGAEMVFPDNSEDPSDKTDDENSEKPDWVNDYQWENMRFADFSSVDDIREFVVSVNSGTTEYEKYIISKDSVSANWAKIVANRIISTPIPIVKDGISNIPLYLRYEEYRDGSMFYMVYGYVIDDVKYEFRFKYVGNTLEFTTPSLGTVDIASHKFEMHRNGYLIHGETMMNNKPFVVRVCRFSIIEHLDDDLSLLAFDSFEFKTMSEKGELTDYVKK